MVRAHVGPHFLVVRYQISVFSFQGAGSQIYPEIKINLDTTFNQQQYDQIYPIGIEHHYWQIARAKVLYSAVVRANLQNEKLLEVGCGRGVVVKMLRKMGIDLKGVELAQVKSDDEVIDHVITGTDAIDLPLDLRQKIKGIFLLDVIEHIEDPDRFTQRIIDHFSNLEYLIITVPAPPDLWSNYDEFCNHFMRYSLKDITSFAQRLGWGISWKSYFFHMLYPVAKVLLQFTSRNEEIKAPVGLARKVHQFIGKLFYLEYKLLPHRWKGSSIISILKRKK